MHIPSPLLLTLKYNIPPTTVSYHPGLKQGILHIISTGIYTNYTDHLLHKVKGQDAKYNMIMATTVVMVLHTLVAIEVAFCWCHPSRVEDIHAPQVGFELSPARWMHNVAQHMWRLTTRALL
jgi:hypothetical protein